MKKVTIAFDIDGTLRCNCTETCQDVNTGTWLLALHLSSCKNVKLIAWSGGGAQYAQNFINERDSLKDLFGTRCFSKLNAPHVDIAFDDQHEFSLGDINLIVKEK